MSREAMLQHLRLQGEETIRRLRQEAEAKVREQRLEAERSLTERRAAAEAESATRLDLRARTALMEAKRQADQIRVMAQSQLAARLKSLAFENLATLRDEEYDQVFALLVGELPAEAWEEVRVHPDDQGRAAAALPSTVIATNSKITGGLEVTGRAGRVQIGNTFEKRLERAWPQLLPQVLADLSQGGKSDQPAP